MDITKLINNSIQSILESEDQPDVSAEPSNVDPNFLEKVKKAISTTGRKGGEYASAAYEYVKQNPGKTGAAAAAAIAAGLGAKMLVDKLRKAKQQK